MDQSSALNRKELKNLKIKSTIPVINNFDPDTIVFIFSSRKLPSVKIKLLSKGLLTTKFEMFDMFAVKQHFPA